jgi:ribosomal protein S27AE
MTQNTSPLAVSRVCPNCRSALATHSIAGHYEAQVNIEICGHCHLIWFDAMESVRISADGMVSLFRFIHEHRDDARNTLSERYACPVCRSTLVKSHNLTKHGKTLQYRCPHGHGHMVTFVQYLRENGYVRELSVTEVDELKAQHVQLSCTNCGAPLNLLHQHACGHCGSPLVMLDVQKAVAAMEARATQLRQRPPTFGQRQGSPLPEQAAEVIIAMHRMEQQYEAERKQRRQMRGTDLLTGALGLIVGGLLS